MINYLKLVEILSLRNIVINYFNFLCLFNFFLIMKMDFTSILIIFIQCIDAFLKTKVCLSIFNKMVPTQMSYYHYHFFNNGVDENVWINIQGHSFNPGPFLSEIC